MDRVIYVAMTGAAEAMAAQSVRANNLANVNNLGFKADIQKFSSQPLYGAGHPTRVFARADSSGVDLRNGALQTTGNALDVAVSGDGWLAVQGADGTERYTRRGDFSLTPEGHLINGAGRVVLGEGGPITIPPAQKINIGQDGVISIVPHNAPPGTHVILDRLKLVNPTPADLVKKEDGLFALKTGATAESDSKVSVRSGVLEGSNVNTVAELVDMITTARQYEMNVKLMKTAEENDQASLRVLQ